MEVGSDVSFTCKVTGNPRTVVYWSKEGQDHMYIVDGNSEDGRFYSADGTLQISQVREEATLICKSYLIII